MVIISLIQQVAAPSLLFISALGSYKINWRLGYTPWHLIPHTLVPYIPYSTLSHVSKKEAHSGYLEHREMRRVETSLKFKKNYFLNYISFFVFMCVLKNPGSYSTEFYCFEPKRQFSGQEACLARSRPTFDSCSPIWSPGSARSDQRVKSMKILNAKS